MRYWLLRRPPHYTEINPSATGTSREYDKVSLNVRLKAGDIVYLLAAYEELYGWGHVIKRESYLDEDLKRKAYRVNVHRVIILQNSISADEIKRAPELVEIFPNSDLTLIELTFAQVNAFNHLLRSKGIVAPADAASDEAEVKPVPNYNFPRIPLSSEVHLWLEAAYSKLKAGKKIVPTEMLVELWEKLPEGFDYKALDKRLLRFGIEPTLLGILQVEPKTELISEVDQVICFIKDLIRKEPTITKVTAEQVSEDLTLPEERAALIFDLLRDLGNFWNGGAGYPDSHGLSSINIDYEEVKREYLSYKGIEHLLNRFYENREPEQTSAITTLRMSLPDGGEISNTSDIAAPADVKEGPLLNNRYKILTPFPSSGFGQTFIGEDTYLPSKRKCVIKQFAFTSNNPETYHLMLARFEREATILERLAESNEQIPDLYAHFSENGKYYLVQEWIDGETVAAKVSNSGPLGETAVKDLVISILNVLDYVHAHSIIHRDIKPENIILRKVDAKPILIDFGAVKEIAQTIVDTFGNASTSIIVGTRGFMPPEQVAGRPAFSSDLYALGLTAIYMLTGKRPDELIDLRTGDIAWLEHANNVSAEFAAVLDKVINPIVRERFPGPKEMLAALDLKREGTLELPHDEPIKSNFDEEKETLKAIEEAVVIEKVDEATAQEKKVSIPPVTLSFSFKELKIESDLHRYALTATLRLNYPPAKNGFLLKLCWPKFIRIIRQQGLIDAGRQQQNGVEYIEFTYEYKDTLWPGKTIDVVGRNDRVELEYEFDHQIWNMVDGKEITLDWSIYFIEDMPVEGQVDFDNLNVF